MGLSKIQSILDRAGRWHSPAMHQYCRPAPWPLSCSSARMDHRELRTRIRLLMGSGELPPDPRLADKILSAQAVRVTRVVIGPWREVRA